MRSSSALMAVFAVLVASCSGSSGSSQGTGGASAGSGGTPGSGGEPGTGGLVGSGGHVGSGGTTGAGGVTPGSGGRNDTGGASGGTTGSGGNLGSAGAGGAAGSLAQGGRAGGGTGGGVGGAGVGGAGVGGAGAPVPSAGCRNAPTLKNSPSTTANYNTVTVGGVSRRYILRLPANYDNTHPYRLILSYHWATGSASQVFNCHTEGIDCYTTQSPFFGLWDLSNGSTIFIAPDGTTGQAADSGSTNNNYWYNAGGADVAFTDEILKQVEADLCIDTSRIELEGFSMGGAMVNTLVCTRPGVFRAVAAHSAGGQPLSTTCQPIPYFASLGSQESGGQTSTADAFAKTNGCTIQTLAKPPTGGHVCSMYPDCSAGHPVRWCPFDGGHTPSPRDSGQSMTWMPKEVWSFLTQY
jgi:poly(3-hydroxybutyrate) depolymerase